MSIQSCILFGCIHAYMYAVKYNNVTIIIIDLDSHF